MRVHPCCELDSKRLADIGRQPGAAHAPCRRRRHVNCRGAVAATSQHGVVADVVRYARTVWEVSLLMQVPLAR